MNPVNKSPLRQITEFALGYIAIFLLVYFISTEKFEHGGSLYVASYYFLDISSILFIFFMFFCVKNEQEHIENPERYWMERGFRADKNNENYDDLFSEFSLDYYSSSHVKNRISDSFSSIIAFFNVVAIAIVGFIYIDIIPSGAKTIRFWAFIPQMFLLLYFIFFMLMNGVCKVLTNRYPGEARRARKIDPYFLIHPN
ncbi:TPA: hypothetical protein ACS71B_000535 [Providencia alcalifaciens]